MKREAMIKVLRYKAEHIKAKIRPEFFAEVADVLEQQPCEDAISRADAVRVASGYCHPANIAEELAKLPPVTPKTKTGYCKDCKWWKDSDGAFRRGIGAESQCPMNRIEVFEGNGYCYMFEPQESEG
jgi:hypothetical protein